MSTCPACGAPATDLGGLSQCSADVTHIDVYDLGAIKGPVRLARRGPGSQGTRPRPDGLTPGERKAIGWARKSCSAWMDKGRGLADAMRLDFPWLDDAELARFALYMGSQIQHMHRFPWPELGPEEIAALLKAAAVELAGVETTDPVRRGVMSGQQAALFGMDPEPAAEPGPPESATVRRTKRQAAMLARGVHPLASPLGYPLRLHAGAAPADDREAPGRRCGSCRFREVLGHHDRSYPKCMAPGLLSAEAYELLGPPRVSHSAATDVRAWWPACTDHDWGDGRLSPDAARWVPGAGEA